MSTETRLRRLWNNPGPDSGWSWVTLVAGWSFMILTFGICRTGTAGVMLVEFLVVFDANRKEAMWPFSILGASECIGGLVSGVLAESFDCRKILIGCAASCTLALVLCFWAQNLTWISLFFGVLFGFGESISMTICFTYLTLFFKKYLATANGLYLSATPVGGFVLPVMMNALINMYGLRGAMLLAGGMVMQLLISATLLRPRTSKYFPCLAEETKDALLLPVQKQIEDEKRLVHKEYSRDEMKRELEEQGQKFLTVMNHGMDKDDLINKKNLLKQQTNNLPEVRNQTEDKEDLGNKEHSIEEQANNLAEVRDQSEDKENLGDNKIYLENQNQKVVSAQKSKEDQDTQRALEQQVLMELLQVEKHGTDEEDTTEEKTLRRRLLRAIQLYKDVLSLPMFYVVTVQSVASINILVGFTLILVDFVMDNGGSRNDGVTIAIVFSISALAGRILCGVIVDRGYAKGSTVSLVGMFVLTVCLATIGNSTHFYLCAALAGCIGFSEGCTNNLINILYKKYVGQKGVATSISLRLFTNGVLAFVRPMIAGYFRNSFGSYTPFFYFLASLSLTSGVLWLFEPFLTTKKERQKQVPEVNF